MTLFAAGTRHPAAPPTSSSAKTAPTPTATSACPAPPPATIPGLICPLRQASLSPRDGRPKVLQPPPEPPGSAPRRRSPSLPKPAPATARTCPTAHRPGTHVMRPCATPSKALNGCAKTPRPPSPRPASPPPRPRHRRAADLHGGAADRRQHPQGPRLAGPDRPRQGRASPGGHGGAVRARALPPRRLTGTADPATLITYSPAGQHAPPGRQQPRIRPAGAPRPGHTAATLRQKSRRRLCDSYNRQF